MMEELGEAGPCLSVQEPANHESETVHRAGVRTHRLGCGRRRLPRIVGSVAIEWIEPEAAGGSAEAANPGLTGDFWGSEDEPARRATRDGGTAADWRFV